MKFKILGSGGAIPTPRVLCKCVLCSEARKDSSLKRNSSCAYIESSRLLIDCPEDIGDSINRFNILEINNLFLTHWHPDHTFGLRILLESGFDFIKRKSFRKIDIFLGEGTLKKLKENFPSIDYYTDILKVAKINIIKDREEIKINNLKIVPVNYGNSEMEWFGFLFNSKLLYTPCDTLNFERYTEFKDIDIWVTEAGIFSYDLCKSEISFPDMLKRFKEINPKRVFLTHLEEVDVNNFSRDYLSSLETDTMKFAKDGLEIHF